MGKTTQLSNILEHGYISQQRYGSIKMRSFLREMYEAAMFCWCPFQEHQHGGQNKTVVGNTQFLLHLIWFCCKSYFKLFTSIFHSIKHFHVHQSIDFCDERDSHNYDNSQLLKNSNLWNCQTKHCFQPKLSENTYTTEF